jgi:D-sedoheptulose 7-phosphate isomerase
MDLPSRINEHFKQHVLLTSQLAPLLIEPIQQASQIISESLLARKKVLCCGNSVCASHAQYLTSRLMGHLSFERPALAAVNLSHDSQLLSAMAISNEFDQVFSRQVAALGEPQDVLFVMCVSGTSGNLVQAVQTAKEQGLQVIAMLGGDGGEVIETLRDSDVLISIPAHEVAFLQEIFVIVMHCICDAVDSILLGVE